MMNRGMLLVLIFGLLGMSAVAWFLLSPKELPSIDGLMWIVSTDDPRPEASIDVPDEPIKKLETVKFKWRPSGVDLEGVLMDERGRPLSGLTVKALPSDVPLRSARAAIVSRDSLDYVASTGSDGSFRVRAPKSKDDCVHLALLSGGQWYVVERLPFGEGSLGLRVAATLQHGEPARLSPPPGHSPFIKQSDGKVDIAALQRAREAAERARAAETSDVRRVPGRVFVEPFREERVIWQL